MELREWLIILGLILMAIIVIDGVRRLQRQRQSSRLDAGRDAQQEEKSEDDIARETAWELPNGGARVVKETTVQPPAYTSSAFERNGLKTRIPESESATSVATQAAVTAEDAVRSASSTTTTIADAEPPYDSARSGAAAEADTMTDAAPKENVTASSTAAPDAIDYAAASFQDEEQHSPVLDHFDDEQNDSEQNELKREVATDTAATRDEQNDDELAPEPFDVPEEEAVDDPRYEGLSEILWRRPLDMFAHLREVLAARRVRKEEAREAARIRRLEARARRAEEKEKRRAEKEAAQQHARAEALALQAQQQEEDERARQQQTASIRHRDPLASLDDDDPLFAPSHREERTSYSSQDTSEYADEYDDEDRDYRDEEGGQRGDNASAQYAAYEDEQEWEDNDYAASERHPDIERAHRHLVNGTQARETLAAASEVIAIAVMARDGDTFDGMVLLKLMLACGLRYCPTTRVFHRFETDDDRSPLQFSVIDTLKPGEFPLDEMDEFTTKGVWLLMPMPGAHELSAAFEAMYETARAIARYLDGELRDENQSVITAQTVEFSRQRVQEFERRAKLYHASH